MKRILSNIFKIISPIAIAAGILWWMYRGIEWDVIWSALDGEMNWTWMILSLPFGILAQVFRALRWKQSLEPMGEKVRTSTCINAIFLSYGSSLVVPRVGELLRCGVLKRYDGVSFSKGIGTVVTERVVDILIILLLSFITIITQIPVFTHIARQTGMSMEGILSQFSVTGYIVTAFCILTLTASCWFIAKKMNMLERARLVLNDMRDGLFSIRYIRRRGLFIAYSVGIWVAYYLHFYLTFFCFDYSSVLGCMPALVAFVVGTFAVLVPTPNGAGPWHFAVKTVLVLFGVSQIDGAVFVLIVHTIQTALVALLGIYSVTALTFTKSLSQTPLPNGKQ